ncbi:helix-turn-helix domain-containing protein [Oscillospiraceae bacterium OttesenSCG-928-F05]|nr:helix-turn-helix domain-containing protein [Oscillospiraceae bacterium OttesenSCG-928-F05]
MFDGKRLAGLREDSDMKQYELAAILGIKSTTLSKYETGTAHPSIHTIIKIAEHFDVSVDYLLGYTDQPHPLRRNNYIVLPDDLPAEKTKIIKEMIESYTKNR